MTCFAEIKDIFYHFWGFFTTANLQHAVHWTQPPSPCSSPFVLFTWRHLQWGHIYRTPSLAVNIPSRPKRHLSVNDLLLSFYSFLQSTLPLIPAARWRIKSLTPSLWGRHSASVILCCVTEYYTLSATWNMTWGFPCSFLVLFCFHLNHSKVWALGYLGSLFVMEKWC